MSYTSGFFDAVDLGEGQYDRVYSSAEFAHFFGLFVGNGVFPSPSTGLSVVCNTPQDMTIKVSPGSGFINGHYLSVPEGGDEYLTLPIAHPSLPRIDSIIMGLDLGERQITLYVKPGQAAAAPEPVALQRDDTIYELELARITLLAGAGSISQPDILDTRPDPDRCGLVTGLIDQFDVSGFFQAAYASFEEWFEGIKGQVDEDVAISLQLQVNELREQLNQDREKTLSAETKELMGLPPEATPSEAFLMLYESSGGAVRRNRPPLSTDAEEVGKLWVVPKMTFNNLMPGALTQATGNWRTSTATLTASGNSLTTVGNASSNQTRVEATLSSGVTPGDKIFVQLKVDVNHDANMMVAELVVGETVLATKSLEFPAAGNVLSLQALTTTGVSGTLVLKLYSTYSTAAIQSGKGFTVSNITVWNLTADMCEAQEDNEFSEVEAANYLSTYGPFQSREYEYSTWWWVLRGVDAGQYFWHRMYDYATATEAQGGTVDTKLMSPLTTQQFYTHRLATTNEAQAGSADTKWMSPLKTQQFFNTKIASQAEVQSGTVDTKVVTPLKLQQKVDPILEDVNKLLSSFKFVKSAEFKTAGTHTWTPTAAQTLGLLVLVGAGGGGASGGQGGNVCGGGGGGGGGEVIVSAIMTFSPNTPVNIVVGAGGKGGAAGYTSTGGYAGSAGGSTSALGMVAEGGKGGGAPSTWNGGAGGAGGGTTGAAGGRGGGSKSDTPGTAGASGKEIVPISPFGNLSAGGGGGKSTESGDTTINGPLSGGTASIGNGGAGSATTGANGGNGAGGGGGGSRAGASGYGGGKGGDGYVAIYTMGVD